MGKYPYFAPRYFNSMIVRLKDLKRVTNTKKFYWDFNSMIVRLKENANLKYVVGSCNFNSMIVRLKALSQDSIIEAVKNFNSMIVRLKGWRHWCNFIGIILFQFYDSPIKSSADKSDDFIRKDFNSMIVRLKVFMTEQAFFLFVVFQFYDSPIKRICTEKKQIHAVHDFNSMIVRLKETKETRRWTKKPCISILW